MNFLQFELIVKCQIRAKNETILSQSEETYRW